MTAAERKRRSRQAKREGIQLRGGLDDPKHLTAMLGGSPQFYRDVAYVAARGVPEWEQLRDNGKGKLIIGASTQRQMVKHLSPQDQLDMIQIAKRDRTSFSGKEFSQAALSKARTVLRHAPDIGKRWPRKNLNRYVEL